MVNIAFVIIAVVILAVFCMQASANVPVRTIAFEGASESLEGQIAIGNVIRNRARQRKQTFEEVSYAPKQFSCYNKTRTPRKLTRKEIEVAKQAWALSEYTGNSEINMYHTIYCKPYWARSPKVKFVCQIGKHIFYKEIR